MTVFLLTFAIFITITIAMAIGYIVQKKSISGSCGGLGALGYMGNKARKMMKKHDKELGRKRGGAVMKARGGTFKGTF